MTEEQQPSLSMSVFREEEQQLKAQRAFLRATREPRIHFIKNPVVIKPNGDRFRIATQSVTDAHGTQSRLSLAKV